MPGTNPMNIKLMTTIRVRIVKEVMMMTTTLMITTISMTTTIMMMTYDEDGINGDYNCMVYFFDTIKIH